MEPVYEVGSVVISAAGKDRGIYYAVVGAAPDGRVLCSDGRKRRLNNPKRKNARHLLAAGPVLTPERRAANRALRRALRQAALSEEGTSRG